MSYPPVQLVLLSLIFFLPNVLFLLTFFTVFSYNKSFYQSLVGAPMGSLYLFTWVSFSGPQDPYNSLVCYSESLGSTLFRLSPVIFSR